MRRILFSLPLLLLAIPFAVQAAPPLVVPNTFMNDTPANANEVNANFDAVEAAVNDHEDRISAAQDAANAAAAGHLDEGAVDAFVSNNGYATGPHTTDTTLDEAAVDEFVSNNDFSTGAHTVNTDTTLDEAQVDAFVANNGYANAVPTTGYYAFGSDAESHRVWDAETGIAWHDSPDNQLRSLDDHNTYLADVLNGGKSNGIDFACLSDGCNLQLPTLHQLEKLARDCVSVAVLGQDDGLWSYTGAQASHCASVWPDPSLGQPGNCTWSRTLDREDATQAYAVCLVEGPSLTAIISIAALSEEVPLRGCGGMTMVDPPSLR